MQDNAYYIQRRTDDELLEALRRGEPCYVAGPPQSGKTSLRARAADRLRAEGWFCAGVGLGEIGAQETPGALYFALAQAIATQLGLPRPADFWERESLLPPAARWQRYLRAEVLGRVPTRVGVFIDELELSRALPVPRGELLTAVEAMRDARAGDPEWGRLAFCLLGAGALKDLSEEGERVAGQGLRVLHLLDFSPEEAGGLLPGLEALPGGGQAWLDAVLEWTSGHPAWTQRLCQALLAGADGLFSGDERAQVEAAVGALLLAGGLEGEPILLDIERRFRKGREGEGGAAMLDLYRRVLAGERVAAEGDDPARSELRLCGLLVEERDEQGARLRLRNRILGRAFDRRWLAGKEDERFLTPRLVAWRDGGRREEQVLTGQALEEALRWAQGRDDVTPEERAFLLAGERAALEAERRRQEEAAVQGALSLADERRRARRLLVALMGAAGLVVLGLLGTIGYLVHRAQGAQKVHGETVAEGARVREQLQATAQDLRAEREAHGKTRAALHAVEGTLAAARRDMESVKQEMGLKEARLKEVGGRIDKIFKKRIITRPGVRQSPSTGMTKEVIDPVMLNRGWPAIRACYALVGPGAAPARLSVELQVQPDGRVSEALAEAPECVLAVLRRLRFPPFSGAYFVRINYQYQRARKP